MSKLPLILAPSLPTDFTVSLAPDGEIKKKELLASAEAIEKVTDLITRDAAINVSSKIATHLKEVEAARKSIKDPFYQTGKSIDDIAKTHIKELEEQKRDLDKMIGRFERELEAERQAELLRLQQEAELAQSKLESGGGTKREKLAAELAAEEIQAKAEERQIELAEQGRKSAATGGRRLEEVTVTVFDIKALYAADPTCVRLEPDLTQIKYLDARGVKLPGVKITRTPKFSAAAK